mmetsp:Transcript_7353/g.20106  ORF Transcript_7353/g.20106 Transcript_7353/m.20106 type:complete len:139 (-) Transcript_7353:276-692(-)
MVTAREHDVCSKSEVPQHTRPTLRTHGEIASEGSALHPSQCVPCTFYCFKRRGCSKDAACRYCHKEHVSKSGLHRAERRERQRSHRSGAYRKAPPQNVLPMPVNLLEKSKRDVVALPVAIGLPSPLPRVLAVQARYSL